jgi:glycine/D-amino acid oxidase-like deaminating enzyme
VTAVAEAAAAAGAEIRTDSEVSGSTTPPGVAVADEAPVTRRFDAVVVAAGAHTADFLGDAGIEVPVVPYRVQALTAGVGGGSASYDGPMVYDATAGAYFRPHPTGLLAGDGTEPVPADPDGYDPTGDDWFVDSVSATLRERLDAVGDEGPDVERVWAGLCTATPDGDPLVGPVGDSADRAFVAAGWQGHGFMRAPAIGELVAEGVLASLDAIEARDPESAWIDGFDPDRFDGDEEFEIAEGMSVESRANE